MENLPLKNASASDPKPSWLVMVFLLLITLAVKGQGPVAISGVILDASGNPLEGISVSIEGVQELPAITDSSGRFSLDSPHEDIWLLVNPVNRYKSRRVYLNRRSTLTIQLTPVDLPSGDDMITGSFRPVLRRELNNSHHVPDASKAMYTPVQTVDQYLQTAVPGLWGTLQSSMPLSGVTSYLRGIRSLSTTSQPLYLVDGIPLEEPGLFQSHLSGYNYNPVASLDAMDITSITILKDYQGGALYGVRGSNGVVLIETLKPSELQTTIDFRFRTGISLQPEQIPQLNSDQYKTLANEVLMSSGLYEEDYTLDYFPLYATEDDAEYYRYNKQTNWQDLIYRNALMNDAYLRVMGGDEIARYGLSVSYLKHQGIIKNTDASRFNVRFVGTFNIFQWLRMHISSNLNTNQAQLKESALASKTSPFMTALGKAPILSPFKYDEEGNQLTTLEDVNSLGVSNPLSVINRFEGNVQNYRFATSFRLEGDILEDRLKWTSVLGINLNSLNEAVFMPNIGMELYYEDEAYNASKSLKNYLFSLYSDNFLSYRQSFRNIHVFSTAIGLRVHQNRFEIDWGIAKNAHERDEYKQLHNGVSYLREMGGESANWNRLGTYADISYTLLDRYILHANAVSEFSSRVGQNAEDIMMIRGEPFGLFYSAGIGWRLSSEPFLNQLHWLGELKIRATYGISGNDDIGNLASLDYYTLDHYRETTSMIPGVITDQTLKFESNSQLNAGVNAHLFGNRVSLTGDWYSIKTSDLVVYEPQPAYLGFNFVPTNNGEITNKGWEVSLNTRIIHRNKLTWDVHLHLSHFNNTVEAIKDDALITPFEGGYFISKVGEPALSFYGYRFLGVYSTREEAELDGLVTEKGVPFRAGDARYEDISGPEGIPDGVINELDREIIGSPIPELTGGAGTTLRYGRWSFSGSVQLVRGREIFNYVRFQNEKMSDLTNQSTNTLERWTFEGQVTDVPRACHQDPVGNSAFSSRWIEDGSYLRVKYLTLLFRIPEKLWFLKNLEVYATATNLFTWDKYLGIDPEVSFSYHTLEQGIDYGMMPPVKSYLLGIRLGL